MRLGHFFIKFIKPEHSSLKIQSIRAAAWSLLEKGASHILRMLRSLILTRLLYPEAFGLMAIATMLLVMIEIFSETGVRTAIIQHARGGDRDFLDTAWVISISKGLLMCLVISAAAFPAALFYQQPDLKFLLWIIALRPMILGFENPKLITVIKNFRVEKKLVHTLGSELLGLPVTIILCIMMKSVYALAISSLVNACFRVTLSYVVQPYLPRFKWNRGAGWELFHFGKFIFLNTIVAWCANNADVLIIGKFVDMSEVGFYSIGRGIGLLLWMVFSQIIGQSYFPAVCSVTSDLPRITTIYKRSLALMLALSIPVSVIIAIFAKDIILLIYDPRYQNAFISMGWLAICGIPLVLMATNSSTFIALGKTCYEIISGAIGFLVVVLCVPLGAAYYGIAGAAVAMLLSCLSFAISESVFLLVKIGFPFKAVFRPWFHMTTLSIPIALLAYFLRSILGTDHQFNILPLSISLVVALLISGLFYTFLEGANPFRDYRLPQKSRGDEY